MARFNSFMNVREEIYTTGVSRFITLEVMPFIDKKVIKVTF